MYANDRLQNMKQSTPIPTHLSVVRQALISKRAADTPVLPPGLCPGLLVRECCSDETSSLRLDLQALPSAMGEAARGHVNVSATIKSGMYVGQIEGWRECRGGEIEGVGKR